jgi:ABC-2 type transport system ATP-binding protein
VLGKDIWRQSVEVRHHVGYLPGDPALYPNMDGQALLSLSLRVRGLENSPLAKRLIKMLNAPMDREVRKCSRGMRQKVALVVTLAHDPEVLVLDEPTSGLDPMGQRALLEFLAERAAAGRTVILSSHILSEVEQVCDRVAILRDGRLVTLDSVENLRDQKYREVTIAFTGDPPSLESAGDVEVVWHHGNRMTLRVRGDVNALMNALAAADLTDVSIAEPTLEEVFLEYYRGGAKE